MTFQQFRHQDAVALVIDAFDRFTSSNRASEIDVVKRGLAKIDVLKSCAAKRHIMKVDPVSLAFTAECVPLGIVDSMQVSMAVKGLSRP